MKYLVYGYYGYGNLGDDLLLDSIIGYISQVDNNAFFTILNKKSPDLKRYNNVEYSDIRDILYTSTNKLLKFTYFFNKFKKFIENHDVFIIGGGTLFMDDGFVNFLMAYLSLFVIYAKLNNKKIILLGIGIDILAKPFSNIWMSILLNNSNKIYCRDALSFQIAKKMMNDHKSLYLTQDLVLANKSIVDNFNLIPKKESKTLGISLIDYCSKFNGDYVNEINSILEYYIEQGFDIKLFSFQLDMDKADNIFYTKLIKSDKIEIVSLNINNFISHFQSIDYLISMRFHGILLGIIFNKKIIGIIHEVKNYQLCVDAGIEYIFLSDLSLKSIKIKNFIKVDKITFQKLVDASNHNFDFLEELKK